ncbi:hypothetical protein AVEN_238355-1 [Araneus ventricosus]|uniref:Uncharacterized protein n=1 Tax=Araneus ventricosus TaxID=182803 RepID=A0A4Y2V3E7_ARAVE|nr:hypothetical protein AVEN_238355-1 [Araneus ventricosus]
MEILLKDMGFQLLLMLCRLFRRHVPVPATITVATPAGWTWDGYFVGRHWLLLEMPPVFENRKMCLGGFSSLDVMVPALLSAAAQSFSFYRMSS